MELVTDRDDELKLIHIADGKRTDLTCTVHKVPDAGLVPVCNVTHHVFSDVSVVEGSVDVVHHHHLADPLLLNDRG